MELYFHVKHRGKKIDIAIQYFLQFLKMICSNKTHNIFLKLQYLVLLQTYTGNFHMIDRIQFMELIHRTHTCKQFQFIQARLSTIFHHAITCYISHVLNALQHCLTLNSFF